MSNLWIAAFTIQILLVCGSDDDAGPIGRFFSMVIDASKEIRRLSPIYPFANIDAPPRTETYDFVIVGASPSGSALANRLSENPNWNVLLLEAGEEPTSLTDIPLLCGAMSFSSFNWGYRAEKQDGFCRGCTDGRVWWAHGKALGGSSIINFMIYVRGNKRDYEKWYEQGNPGWSYEDLLPYFLKSEDAHLSIKDEDYHERGGYLKVSDVPFRTRIADVWVQATQEAGYPYVDYNGRDQYGVSYVQTTTGFGKRWSAEKAFLRPIRDRPNLTIRINSLVLKVLVDKNNIAYGVEYIKNGKIHKVKASKEVILSAGSLNSPKILMLSGIGPADHLDELGIPLVADLPVGKQMYDHMTFPALAFTVNESIVLDTVNYLTNPRYLFQYVNTGTGPFSSIGGVEALTYIRSNASDDPDPRNPDVELIFTGASVNTDLGIFYRRLFNVPMSMYEKVWRPLEKKNVFSVLPMLLHPKSKGFMKLKSKNPFDDPLFYANYLSDPENHDVRALIYSIREVQRIAATPTFQRYNAKIVATPLPGCESPKFNSDEYWECALRTLTGSLWHQVATCKMGPSDDVEAVVDSELRVHGINNLRVVDTGIIPVTLSAHTVGPAYMIGEKAADIIKLFWIGQ